MNWKRKTVIKTICNLQWGSVVNLSLVIKNDFIEFEWMKWHKECCPNAAQHYAKRYKRVRQRVNKYPNLLLNDECLGK